MTAAAITRRVSTWPQQAACRGADPEPFGPHGIARPDVRATTVAAAQRYCARCPVIADCAAEADRDGLQGVWGGTHRLRDNSGRGDIARTPLIPAAPRKATR